MQTITVDILNEKAIKLLQDLELLKLIRMRNSNLALEQKTDFVAKYKGAMSKQSITDIDAQLNELRNS